MIPCLFCCKYFSESVVSPIPNTSDFCRTTMSAQCQDVVTLESSIEEVVNHRADLLGDKEDEDIVSLGMGNLNEEFVEQVNYPASHEDTIADLICKTLEYPLSNQLCKLITCPTPLVPASKPSHDELPIMSSMFLDLIVPHRDQWPPKNLLPISSYRVGIRVMRPKASLPTKILLFRLFLRLLLCLLLLTYRYII